MGPPANFSSRNRYNGVNVLLLGSLYYESPFWLTFRQAKELGGHVKKGEKGALVLKYGTYTPKEAKDRERGGEETEIRGYLRHYAVFNACQIEGISFPERKEVLQTDERTAIERADAIVASMPQAPVITEGHYSRAFYSRTHDSVNLPDRRRFESPERFYQVLFHEVVHASGHEKRLARKSLLEQKEMGDRDYSKEELVAEMGAAFLSAEANIALDDIASWLKVLRAKENKRWIVQAANQASRAARFILGTLESDA